jgi:hypothetical protein
LDLARSWKLFKHREQDCTGTRHVVATCGGLPTIAERQIPLLSAPITWLFAKLKKLLAINDVRSRNERSSADGAFHPGQ